MSKPLYTRGQPVMPLIIHRSEAYPPVRVPERFLHISGSHLKLCRDLFESISVTQCHLTQTPGAHSSRGTVLSGKHTSRHFYSPGTRQPSAQDSQADDCVPHIPRCPGSLLCFLKFSFSHLLTRPILSKTPSAHSMLCFQGTSGMGDL